MNAKKTLYNVLNIIEKVFIVFIAIIAVINMVMLFQQKVLGYTVPKIFGYSYVNVLSGSMEPGIKAGDLAICKERESYEIGDAILFEDDGYLILHRITENGASGGFITKGDANNVADDDVIHPESIHGECVKVFPELGNTIAYLTSRTGAFWTILATLFIYLALGLAKDVLWDRVEVKAGPAIETSETVSSETAKKVNQIIDSKGGN